MFNLSGIATYSTPDQQMSQTGKCLRPANVPTGKCLDRQKSDRQRSKPANVDRQMSDRQMSIRRMSVPRYGNFTSKFFQEVPSNKKIEYKEVMAGQNDQWAKSNDKLPRLRRT